MKRIKRKNRVLHSLIIVLIQAIHRLPILLYVLLCTNITKRIQKEPIKLIIDPYPFKKYIQN